MIKWQKMWIKRLAEVDEFYPANLDSGQTWNGIALHAAAHGALTDSQLVVLDIVDWKEAFGDVHLEWTWLN